MPPSTTITPERFPAERVRSALAAASSLMVTASRCRMELIDRHIVDRTGRLLLTVSPDSALALAVTILAAPPGDDTATVEVTDLSPVATRDRIRARVRLVGRLATNDGACPNDRELRLRFDPKHAVLEEGSATMLIPASELAAACPDPLAEREADILTHLDATHPDTVARLARLVDTRALQGAQRVLPVRVNRHGLVLRVERARTHQDALLPFATPLRCADELWAALQRLLADAAACPRRRRSI